MRLNTCVLWTGGKDSNLALHELSKDKYKVVFLVTFISRFKIFKAHPLKLMKLQAQALELPHWEIIIDEPYRTSYQNAIKDLKEQKNIECIVTGDIDVVDGHENWIRTCAKDFDIKIVTPLWKKSRRELLHKIYDQHMDVRFFCLTPDYMDHSWFKRTWDLSLVRDLEQLETQFQADPCGENGEYHTMVLDAPLYKKRIHIDSYHMINEKNIRYIAIDSMHLELK